MLHSLRLDLTSYFKSTARIGGEEIELKDMGFCSFQVKKVFMKSKYRLGDQEEIVMGRFILSFLEVLLRSSLLKMF